MTSLKSIPLSLQHRDDSSFKNTTGYSISTLADMQVLFACRKAARGETWDQSERMFASDAVKAGVSPKIQLVTRGTSGFRTAWAEVVKQGRTISDQDRAGQAIVQIIEALEYLLHQPTSFNLEVVRYMKELEKYPSIKDSLQKAGTDDTKLAKAEEIITSISGKVSNLVPMFKAWVDRWDQSINAEDGSEFQKFAVPLRIAGEWGAC